LEHHSFLAKKLLKQRAQGLTKTPTAGRNKSQAQRAQFHTGKESGASHLFLISVGWVWTPIKSEI